MALTVIPVTIYTPSSGGGGSSSKSSSPKAGNEAVAADNSTNARIVANILLSKGWSREEVSGMIGNLMRESGGDTEDLNARAEDGSHTHRGIAQRIIVATQIKTLDGNILNLLRRHVVLMSMIFVRRLYL